MFEALVVHGGWDGHQPKEVGEIFRSVLVQEGFHVQVSDTLDAFNDVERLKKLDLIVPVWTMGKITGPQSQAVSAAVESGVGIAGCHGGMGDAFREDCGWQFMVGGQFVAHPGNQIPYTVNIRDTQHEITTGLGDFHVLSELYYMHVDPCIKILAVSRMPAPNTTGPHLANGAFEMPVVWTKMHGKGRVFYSSVGHDAKVVADEPHLTIMRRGFKWATAGKALARG